MPRRQPQDDDMLDDIHVHLRHVILNGHLCKVEADLVFFGDGDADETTWYLYSSSYIRVDITPVVGKRNGKRVVVPIAVNEMDEETDDLSSLPNFESLFSRNSPTCVIVRKGQHFQVPHGMIQALQSVAQQALTSKSIETGYKIMTDHDWRTDPALDDDQIIDFTELMQFLKQEGR